MVIADAPKRVKGRWDRTGEIAETGRKICSWTVLGDPKAQPRPRAYAAKIGGRTTARVYNPDSADAWKAQIAHTIGRAEQPILGPVAVRIDLLFPRPQRLRTRTTIGVMTRHTSKPDTDNAAKPILDVLTELGWWRDDSQVAEILVSKWYAAEGDRPGARIMIEELPQ